MDILAVEKILPVKKVSEVAPKEQAKKQEISDGGLTFAEILQNLTQQQLSTSLADKSSGATQPVAITNTVSTSRVLSNTQLPGDYLSSFTLANPTEADKVASPQGNARGSLLAQGKTIDKTSKLYEQSLELESYFVKILIDSMKNTLQGNIFGEESYASKMYRDMMFEELSRTMTKNAGFGLADQIYLELVDKV